MSVLAIFALLFFPFIARWPIARLIFIPLGMPRSAYYMAMFADLTWGRDRRGGAALAGAWALCRAGRRDDAIADWLDAKLQRAGGSAALEGTAEAPLSGGGVAAAAMLAAYRGDIAGARILFESVATLDERVCPPEACRIASGWLAAEAASRGDWQAVLEMRSARHAGADAWLLAGVAARLLDDPVWAPSDIELWLRWAIAPHRRATLPLVRRALAARPGAPRPAEPEVRAARVPEGDLWSRAVVLHATLLLRRGGRIAGDDLRRLGGAWDAAFEDERAQAEIRERALTIGAASPDAALGSLRRVVEEDLAAMARAARIPRQEWEDLGETIGRATRLLRDELLSEIELACEASRLRVDERRELSPVDEWRAWIALRTQYEAAAEVVGMEFRRLAFTKVHPDVCHLGVWLFNVRKERPIANAMFRWLLAEAEALGDTRAADLQRKNLECGL